MHKMSHAIHYLTSLARGSSSSSPIPNTSSRSDSPSLSSLSLSPSAPSTGPLARVDRRPPITFLTFADAPSGSLLDAPALVLPAPPRGAWGKSKFEALYEGIGDVF